jgi:hypothetical protein
MRPEQFEETHFKQISDGETAGYPNPRAGQSERALKRAAGNAEACQTTRMSPYRYLARRRTCLAAKHYVRAL